MSLADLSNPAQRPTRYFYGGESQWQVCEEQDGSGDTVATYVYGRYIDEVLQMQRCESTPPCTSPGGTSTPPADYYYHTDDLYNVMAVTDDAGNVVERYEYDDYGTPTFMNANGDVLAQPPGNREPSWIANPYLFTGRRFDPETAWYHYRTRYLDPAAGRFTTRDTIGIWGDPGEHGNGYTYVRNNPGRNTDPFGLAPGDKTFGLPREFWQWWHREVKPEGYGDIKSREEALEWYKQFKEETGGKGAKGKGCRGRGGRRGPGGKGLGGGIGGAIILVLTLTNECQAPEPLLPQGPRDKRDEFVGPPYPPPWEVDRPWGPKQIWLATAYAECDKKHKECKDRCGKLYPKENDGSWCWDPAENQARREDCEKGCRRRTTQCQKEAKDRNMEEFGDDH
jgi:RHS repeat-associated protein